MFSRILPLLLLLLICDSSFATDDDAHRLFDAEYAKYTKYAAEKKWKQALPSARKVYELGLKLYPAGHKNTAAITYNYAMNLIKTRQREEGIERLLEAVPYYEATYGEGSKELAPLLMDVADNMPPSTGLRARLKYISRALKITKSHYGKHSDQLGQRSVQAGVILMRKERAPVAKSYLKKGYKILLDTRGASDSVTAYAAFNLGKYEMSMRSNKKAIKYFHTALESFDDPQKPSNRVELATHGFLVSAYEKIGERELATKHCLAIGRMTPKMDTQNYQPLFKPAPSYPTEAAKERSTGYVIVRYDVDEMGFVRNPEVTENTGHESLIDASIKAAKNFRYAPRFIDGKAVTTRGVRNKFSYTLN